MVNPNIICGLNTNIISRSKNLLDDKVAYNNIVNFEYT